MLPPNIGEPDMHKRLTVACLTAVVASPSIGQAPPPGPAGPALPPEYRAYLGESGVHRETYVAMPAARSLADKRDRTAFRETRKLENTPRWTLAQADAGRGILKAFSCAAGINLTNDNSGALVTLLSRYRTDLLRVTRMTEATATRRPYERDKGPVCVTDKALKTATGTPAIQSAWGWTVALILGEALPAHTDALMLRGRAYGESAGICGFASVSEVEGGRDLGAAMLSRARAEPGFAADLAKATAEIGALAHSGGPAPEGCAAEVGLVSRRTF